MNKVTRTFDDKPAVRERVPLLLGITGYTSSGKTFSSFRIATGMQKIIGGEIFCIDTESKRALQLADRFKFRHVDLCAPFSPLDYLAALEHCKNKGASIVIIDSMTHEHSSEGGYLDQADKFLERTCGDDEGKRKRMTALSWKAPSAQRKKLNDWIIHSGINAIFCYRAKEKMNFKSFENEGWQPETTSALIYEMTARFLLTPGSDGKPTFNPEHALEKMLTKNPEFFKGWFQNGMQLNEDLGQKMAEWAQGKAEKPRETKSVGKLPGTESQPQGASFVVQALTKMPSGDLKITTTDERIFSTPSIDEFKEFASANKGRIITVHHIDGQIERWESETKDA